MKHIDWMLVSLAMIMQLTGCGGHQATDTETVTTSSLVVSSSTAAPPQTSVQSSIPAPSASELSVEVELENMEEPSQSAVQLSSSTGQSASSTEQPTLSVPPASTSSSEETNMNHITIEVGGKTFSVTLAENEAARAFTAFLPMTVQMGELNGQEKFYGLPDKLPADSSERPSTIRNGDIFCWSGNTLVLFYNTFQNSYGGYVRLGTVDNPAELAAALGSGNTEVTWSLNQ